MEHKGLFISFEGPDGSGKSTHIKRLGEKLKDRGFDPIIVTREPGGTERAEAIRDLLLSQQYKEPMSARTEALLYAAARAQHIDMKIFPALERGEVVITDRYVDSSYAYQGFGRELGFEKIRDINDFATSGLMPDLSIFLMVDTNAAFARMIADNRELDRLETAGFDFHERVNKGFAALVKMFPDRVRFIDASRSKEEVHLDVVREVDDCLVKKFGSIYKK